MDANQSDLNATLLPAIACKQPYSQESAAQLYRNKAFHFALVRWGNLDMRLPKTLGASSMVYPQDAHFQVLRGRDEDERILVAADGTVEDFLSNLCVYMTKPGHMPTWTAVYSTLSRGIEALPGFVDCRWNCSTAILSSASTKSSASPGKVPSMSRCVCLPPT